MKLLAPKRITIILCLLFAPTLFSSFNWNSKPLTVHEWGVNTFDWKASDRLSQTLPAFFHTDQNPGVFVPDLKNRVRDKQPDSGFRTKPILYFYGDQEDPNRFTNSTSIGVEMRFAYGHAIAWWPQVNSYRTREMVQNAKAPDWDKWKNNTLKIWKDRLTKDSIWQEQYEIYQRLDPKEQIAYLASANRFLGGDRIKFPEDQRMELVWDSLKLSTEIPEGLELPGADLLDDHWVKVARQVDALYVSNGGEAERYVFYEGKTRENPAIALIPADRSHPKNQPTYKDIAVVNISQHPIYDVIAVYRDSERDLLWTRYIAMLPANSSSVENANQTVALRIPDFDRPGAEDQFKIDRSDFEQATKARFIESLTAGFHLGREDVFGRDPSHPQPPTTSHYLFEKEAIGLEKIWHDEFFEAEGLTIIYRESPAYLDEAMPLNIYTDMYWYVKLSRCGLVLNRNLPVEEVDSVAAALHQFSMAQWNPNNDGLQESAEKAKAVLKRHKFLTLGQSKFLYSKTITRAIKELFEE